MVETITYKVKGNLEQILPIYADLKKFASHHPLIQRVEKLSSNSKGQLYTIYEKPFSWLPIKINYRAKVTKKDDFSVDFEITEIPFTRAYFNYVFSEEVDQTVLINLRIEILSKIIYKRILMKMMIKAQDRIVEAIQNK